MERKFAWLGLPLALVALMLGVKWRAEHPTPTKLDLEVRQLMSESLFVEVTHYSSSGAEKKLRIYRAKSPQFPKRDLALFIDCLYASSEPIKKTTMVTGNGDLEFNCPIEVFKEDGSGGIFVNLNVDSREGEIGIWRKNTTDKYKLHPITAKRWIELLLANPRIGPELRARMKF